MKPSTHIRAMSLTKKPAGTAAPIDEQRLVVLMRLVAQNLDRSAFSELFDVIAPRLKARLMKSGADSALAEDILQDVMVNLWTKAGLFDPSRGSVFAWVHTIARNLYIDRKRRAKPSTSIDHIAWDPVDDSESAEAGLIMAGDIGALRHALAKISPEQRQIVDMTFVDELTQVDISARLKIPLGTVKSRLRLAFATLRKNLEKTV